MTAQAARGESLDSVEPAELLRLGFQDAGAALQHVEELLRLPHAREWRALLPELLARLSESAEPLRALVRFERFARAHRGQPSLATLLRQRPRVLELLATVFGASPFLAETLIRHPEWLDSLSQPEQLPRRRTRLMIESDLEQALRAAEGAEGQLAVLRLFKRRELLEIGARDLLRVASVDETLLALSELAEALIQSAWLQSDRAQRRHDGLAEAAPRTAGSGFTVLGLGKLGGAELNFSSDVDLVYLYSTDRGRMARPAQAPTRPDFARHLARRVTAALAETTSEGAVYRVDLRLRPEGRSGPVAGSLRSFQQYYRSRGATWERLALLKAWPVAGDRELGSLLLQRVRPFVFGRPFGPEAVREVLRIKAGLDRRSAQLGESDRDVKLGIGGIREIELIVQTLQIVHGRRLSSLHVRGTLPALAALRETRLVPEPEGDALQRAYLFMRDLENKLQMVADAQVHVLPRAHEELRACARRLGYRDAAGATAEETLLRAHRNHTETVHRIFGEQMSRLEQG
jgi:glutamate-ammonia-ligase adenylyltransferase